MRRFALIVVLLLSVITAGVLFSAYTLYKRNTVATAIASNVLFPAGQVLGVSSDETEVTADFSRQTAAGSPLIFGGAHAPRHTKAWDEIQSEGFTVVRSDFYLDRFLPTRTTLEQYQQNVNNVKDPATWNQTEIQKVRTVFQETRKRNMKSMGIMAYSINWLTTSGTHYGPAKDWAVYEDIVEKSYRLFRNDVDYLELWNEPDMDNFMNTKNSGLTKEAAYYETVKHAVAAIRKVDREIGDGKRMKLGIGVVSRPTHAHYVDKILADANLKNEIDFVSYHNYEHIPEPTAGQMKASLSKYGMSHLPIFLTEWSHTPDIKKSDPYILTDLGIPYTGSKLIDYLNQGLGGANYFSLQPLMPDSPRGDEGMLGIYSANGESVSMLPLVKTWTLMSNTLRLGKGASKVYHTDNNIEKVAAWQNLDGEYGIVMANSGYNAKEVTINLSNLPFKGNIQLTAYAAAPNSDGEQEVGKTIIKNDGKKSSFKAVLPPTSVVGIIISRASWRDALLF